MNNNYFWNQLNIEEITEQIPKQIFRVATSSGFDEAGLLLNKYASSSAVDILPRNYWRKLKKEFFLLICTDHVKYSKTRKELHKSSDEPKTLIVSVVSAAIADNIGLAAGTITPFCLLCLFGLLNIGKEAFCESFTEP